MATLIVTVEKTPRRLGTTTKWCGNPSRQQESDAPPTDRGVQRIDLLATTCELDSRAGHRVGGRSRRR